MFKFGYTVIGDLVRYIGTEDEQACVKMYYIPKKRYDLIMLQSGHEMDIDSYRHSDYYDDYFKVGYTNRCRECNHSVKFTDFSHSPGYIVEQDYDHYVQLILEQKEKDKEGFEKFKKNWVEKCLRKQQDEEEGWTTVGKRR